jgi:exosortase
MPGLRTPAKRMTVLSTSEIRERPERHHLCFLLFAILAIIALRSPLKLLLTLSLRDDRYSHIFFVPLISVALIWLARRTVFCRLRFSVLHSVPFLLAAIAGYWVSLNAPVSVGQDGRVILASCTLIAVWMAGFVLCYGMQSFRAALFPLLFLLLMVPLPPLVIDKAILLLQKGSAVAAYGLFRAFGVPVYWSGFKFALPGVEIEVAKECSGIRSCISLLITGIVAGHVFLNSNWNKLIFSLLTIPVAIFKNAVRIVTISCLGVYVDQSFLFGKLHRYGGVPFTLIALAILLPALLMLQRGEGNSQKRKAAAMPRQ